MMDLTPPAIYALFIAAVVLGLAALAYKYTRRKRVGQVDSDPNGSVPSEQEALRADSDELVALSLSDRVERRSDEEEAE